MVRGGHLSQGCKVAAFEQGLADRLCRKGGAATSSGTAALALALRALDLGPGGEVILPAFACAALADAVRFAGASPVLADVGDDLALAPAAAAARIGRRTRAIVVVHPFGHPADVGAYLEWGIPVIEDCAQALGASRPEGPAGGLGTAAVCSFYATKVVATGEGGMVLADDDAILSAVRSMRSGGGVGGNGFNFKLSDLAAALGLAQVARLDAFLSRRRRIAELYDEALDGTVARIPAREHLTLPCFSRYVVRVPDAARFIAGMCPRGVEAKRAVGDPLFLKGEAERCPQSVRAYAECVSLPIYPSLDDGAVERVLHAARRELDEGVYRW